MKNLTNILNSLDATLTTNNSCTNVIVIRDININIAVGNIDSKATNYLNLMACHGLLPAHNIPTSGKTSQDHIILKTRLKALTLVIDSTVTDHSAVMLALDNTRTPVTRNTKTKIDYVHLHFLVR